jgi:hypothetical protein
LTEVVPGSHFCQRSPRATPASCCYQRGTSGVSRRSEHEEAEEEDEKRKEKETETETEKQGETETESRDRDRGRT